MQPIENLTQRLKCELTDEEFSERSSELGDALQNRAEIEAEKKAAAALYKSRIEEAEEMIANLGNTVRTKSEYREVKCQKEVRPRQGLIITIRLDTGATIDQREMTPGERQLELGDGERPPDVDF